MNVAFSSRLPCFPIMVKYVIYLRVWLGSRYVRNRSSSKEVSSLRSIQRWGSGPNVSPQLVLGGTPLLIKKIDHRQSAVATYQVCTYQCFSWYQISVPFSWPFITRYSFCRVNMKHNKSWPYYLTKLRMVVIYFITTNMYIIICMMASCILIWNVGRYYGNRLEWTTVVRYVTVEYALSYIYYDVNYRWCYVMIGLWPHLYAHGRLRRRKTPPFFSVCKLEAVPGEKEK